MSGYRVKVTHRPGQMVPDDWHVSVTRLSDGEEIIRIFAWKWRAERFARSERRIERAFARQDRYRARAGRSYTALVGAEPSVHINAPGELSDEDLRVIGDVVRRAWARGRASG